MSILRAVPLFAVMWVVYNLVALTGAEGVLQGTLFTIPLISGAAWTVSVGDLLIILGLLTLFVEIFKSTRTTATSIMDHSLSMVVFIAFLVQFITVAAAGNSVFFILGLMALLDVVAGFTVTIMGARRDFAVGDEPRI
jgi:hypothetical protein